MKTETRNKQILDNDEVNCFKCETILTAQNPGDVITQGGAIIAGLCRLDDDITTGYSVGLCPKCREDFLEWATGKKIYSIILR